MHDTTQLAGHGLYLAMAFGASLTLVALELAMLRRRARAARAP